MARQWFDRDGVDLIVEVANSGVALAVAGVAKEKNKVYINSGAATSDLTGSACNANTIHWVYDTYMLAKSTGGAMVKTGGDSWFFITADYAFGKALQRDTTEFVTAPAARWSAASPIRSPAPPISRRICCRRRPAAPRSSGMANAGADTINTIKQAKEFGIKMRLAGLLLFLTDIHSLGLEIAQGIVLTDSFYWDMNDRDARVLQPVRRKVQRRTADHGAGRRLFLHAALPEDGDRHGRGKAKRDGAATVARNEGDADRRRLLRARHPSAPTAARCIRPICGRSRSRPRARGLGLLQAGGHHPGRPGVPAARQGRLPAGESLAEGPS